MIALVIAMPRLGVGHHGRGRLADAPGDGRGRSQRAARASAAIGEAVAIVRKRDDPLLLAGAIGYWAFDNAVLWATFQAFDVDVAADRRPAWAT